MVSREAGGKGTGDSVINMDAEKKRPEGTAIQIGPGEATYEETSRAIMHEIEDELIENAFMRRVGELVASAGGADATILRRTLGTIRKRLFPTTMGVGPDGPFAHTGPGIFPGGIGLLVLSLVDIEDGRYLTGFATADAQLLARASDPEFFKDPTRELTIELASDGIVEALGDLGGSMVRDPFATLCALRLICAICPVSGEALAKRDDFASAAIWVIGRDTSDGRRPVTSGFARLERRVSEAVYRAVHGAAEVA
jgi:hypothetical protein